MKKGKRLVATLLAAVMMLSVVPSVAAADGFSTVQTYTAGQFSDVEVGQWYETSVQKAYELGLMCGDPNGMFRPAGQVTLAETVTVAARIHALATTGAEVFEQGTPWYQVYVDYALQNGILAQALADCTKPATRLEFAQILAKALPAEDLTAINQIADGAIPDVADEESVYLLYRAGVLTGNDAQGTFLPDSTIQRSEVAAIVTRMALPELRQLVSLDGASGLLHPVEDEDDAEEKEDHRVIIRDEEDEDEAEDIPDNVQATVPVNPDYVDENNALTKPFDQVYPDLFASGEIDYDEEKLLIKVASEPTGAQQASLADAGVDGLELFMDLDSGKWYKAYVSGDVTEVMDQVRDLSFVTVAEYDYTYETEAIVLDSDVKANTNAQNQWYLDSCGIQDGWHHLKHPHHRPNYDEENGSTDSEQVSGVVAGDGIVVAVIDTGVDYTHEDLAANIWVNKKEINNNGIDDDGNGYVDDYYGANVITHEGSAMDDQGHGTHVAGIIAGVNNDTGIVGIAYESKIMPVKAGMASGYFNQSDIAEAIIYAYEQGADVINMSFGGTASSIAVQDALTTAYTRCVLVAAAGNDGAPNEGMGAKPTYPAALAYVLGVMSVDENGVESNFTNYDVAAFNSVEYEVYAPGEEMISTIPGNRYATWSGTSMATPVVSAMAALLRSEFRDNATYPTKFIYGQICGTGTENASCCGGHGTHNLPSIVDIYNALTVLPTPDVGVTNYTIFDTVGLKGNEKNDGDGVIDAGETIAIGFTLRNKWGKSENTMVSVDTLSQTGIADPYITIHNPSVNYGSVGTYSTQDAGKVMDGDLWVGWENPVYITVATDCPNDYACRLNINVSCENALDAADSTVYTSEAVHVLGVQNGTVLPRRIREDMTLTADQLYIIPHDVLIMADATVTIEPGAQIQFWSNEPNDAYAEKAIACINVEGKLISNGTEDNHVRMFPSQLKDNYAVEITVSDQGVVKLFYTDVVNPVLTITYAEGCIFTQNYRAGYFATYQILDGEFYDDSEYGCVQAGQVKNCAYYQLGYVSTSAVSTGRHDGCIFVDCSLNLAGEYQNCVFYGNNNYLGEKTGSPNKMTVYSEIGITEDDVSIVIDEQTGMAYVAIRPMTYVATDTLSSKLASFAEYLDGTLLCVNTEQELAFIQQNWYAFNITDRLVRIGLERDFVTDTVHWQDGSAVDNFLDYEILGSHNCSVLSMDLFDKPFCGVGVQDIVVNHTSYTAWDVLLELPASQVSWTPEMIVEKWNDFEANEINPTFYNNAILNRLDREDRIVEEWMRLISANMNADRVVSIGGNYWGTTDSRLIEKQIFDFEDSQTLIDLKETPYLTEAPENVWPFVTNAGILDANGNETVLVGNETLTFYVEFNRDMDTSIDLNVRFGSYYPYADYAVEGEWVSDRRWEGTTTLTTLIEGGYQYWSIDNGKAADAPMKLYRDWGRFPFEIDTSEALAMTLQGYATENGIQLTWTQDDFDTLMGYNVYRAEQDADAYYQRLNSSIIPVGEEQFFDDTVEPAKDYYYIFTVVKTDLTESEPSGKRQISSLDTMAPVMYYTPVYEAYVGNNIVISATVTDNLAVQSVKLYYSVAGGAWKTIDMQQLNDKYSALISGNNVTLDGIRYYIVATDGVSTVYRGTKESPYTITVKDAPTSLVAGDVNGDGVIGIADALLVLRAKNNKVVLTSEQFTRADLDEDGILSAAEALKILRYANGEINSLR